MKETFSQHLPASREALFAFHEDPAHLIELLSGWRYSRIASHDGHIRPGARLHIIERLGPFRIPLVFEHVVYEPPARFGERQIKGPFRVFEHVHEFVETADGTLIRDHVTIALPMWLGGELATRLFVVPRLRRFFAFRQSAMLRLLAGGRVPGASA